MIFFIDTFLKSCFLGMVAQMHIIPVLWESEAEGSKIKPRLGNLVTNWHHILKCLKRDWDVTQCEGTQFNSHNDSLSSKYFILHWLSPFLHFTALLCPACSTHQTIKETARSHCSPKEAPNFSLPIGIYFSYLPIPLHSLTSLVCSPSLDTWNLASPGTEIWLYLND